MIFDITNTVLECLNRNILLVVFTDGSCALSVIFIVSNAKGGENSCYYLKSVREIQRYRGSFTF